MTVTTSPLHRGEHEVSRKAVAQGMSECFRSPVCSCAPFYAQFGTRDRGCSAHPAFPAPSLRGGRQRICITRAQIVSRDQFLSSLRTQGPIRRGGSDLEKWSTTLLNQLNPVVMGPCSRAQLRTRQGRHRARGGSSCSEHQSWLDFLSDRSIAFS